MSADITKAQAKLVEAVVDVGVEEILSVAARHGKALRSILGDDLDADAKGEIIELISNQFAKRITERLAAGGKLSPKELGKKIMRANIEGGGVKGLHILLKEAFGVGEGI